MSVSALTGGFAHLVQGNNLNITNAKLLKCHAGSDGGLINSISSNIYIVNSVLNDIVSEERGGGFCVQDSSLILENLTFTGVRANLEGSIIYA